MSKPLQVNSQDPDRYTGTRVLFLSASSGMQWLHQNYPLGSGRATFSTRFDLQIGGFPSFGAPSPIYLPNLRGQRAGARIHPHLPQFEW